MKTARWPIALTLLTMALAQPAMAQSRAKDDRRRTEARQPATADRGERRRDPAHATSARAPERPAPPARPRDDERERRERDRDRLGPIQVLSPRVDYDPYGRRIDSFYGSHRYRYDRYDRAGRVWRRTDGMTCLQLADELEWAHDEWHHRNDRHRGASWYDVEHARLELRIAEERAYSGCGRMREELDCSERGRYARTGDSLAIALHVLELLLGDHDRARW